eukprot:260716_1
MSTRETVKKPKKKQRRKLQLRSKYRRHANKTKRKSIGLKNMNNTSELIINNNTQSVNNISNNSCNNISPNKTTSSSISTSSQSSSNKSTTKRLLNKKRRRKKPSIGLNSNQKKYQIQSRQDKKNLNEKFQRVKSAKLNMNNLNNISSIERTGLTIDDILPMRSELHFDSSLHIIRNLGKQKIHIHSREKYSKYNSENAQNLLHINGAIKSFKYLKVNDNIEFI